MDGDISLIAVRILRYYGEQNGLPRNFVILDETDRLSLVKTVMRELNIVDKQFNPRTIASLISTAKNDMPAARRILQNRSHAVAANSRRGVSALRKIASWYQIIRFWWFVARDG